LIDKGFEIEHENLYYILDLNDVQTENGSDFLVKKSNGNRSIHDYKIFDGDKNIGGLQIRYIDELSGGETTDVVYLTWIWIGKESRRQGWARKSIMELSTELQTRGYRYFHTDTAHDNLAAQQMYESLGFVCMGKTRSFVIYNR
jgi:ribosomal protein S18 acetylase RimI-like enzyme